MTKGRSYKRGGEHGSFDAIVIGSGVGGLAAASALARYGNKRVLVLERHYRIGGYTHTFTRPGYEWDVGVHYLGELGPRGVMRALFERLTDNSIEWAPLPDVYDRVVIGGRAYDYVTGTRRFISKMTSYFPREGEAIARYVTLIKQAARSAGRFYLERALPEGVARVVGSFLRRGYLRYATRTTRDVLSELTRNEELIGVLTAQFGDYGLPPGRSSFAMHAAVATHYLGGAYYPVGGASAIARAFAPVIERAGGALVHSAEVARVSTEGGRAVGVVMIDGEVIRAPIVISDAGAANTFQTLTKDEPALAPLRQALAEATPSVGYLCLYLGFKATDAELGTTGTNLWIYPSAAHDENISRFLEDPAAPIPLAYVSFPSAKDPSFATRYPGRATVDVITLCPWSWVDQWKHSRWMKRGGDYEAFKAEMTRRLLDVVFTELPQLRGRVDHAELSTPLSTRHFAGHPRGELYGLDHDPKRYQLPIRAKTPLAGFYLTGADLVSCGVGGALFGGALTASAILGPRGAVGMWRRS